MKKKQFFIVNEETGGVRLDIFLAGQTELNRSQVQKLILADLVLHNNKLPKKAGDRVKVNDSIEILASDKKNSDEILEEKNEATKVVREIKDIEIIAETKDYLVINKPAGLLVHPTEAHEKITLASWLLKKYPTIKKVGESPERPGIVHRLDKEASGLLVIAKNQKMYECLKQQFLERTVDKEYLVLVHGEILRDFDSIDFEIDRGSDGRMVARPKTDKLKLKNVNNIQEGKEAYTEFEVEKRFARYTLLRVKILTGRTNQIRVHMLAYNHPVVGDQLYFNKRLNRIKDITLDRVFLHSVKLGFRDLKGVKKCFENSLPVELESFLSIIK